MAELMPESKVRQSRMKWSEVAKKDVMIQKIFVCLYLCPGNCETDPTCPWRDV